MTLLTALGLMTRKEHERDKAWVDCDLCSNSRVVRDHVDSQSYPETAPCPKCRVGSWALKAAREWQAKYKKAITDLELQTAESKRVIGNLKNMVGKQSEEIITLRPDALAMRRKRAADRKRMAGKRNG